MKRTIAWCVGVLAAGVGGFSCQKPAQDKAQAAAAVRAPDDRQAPAAQGPRFIVGESGIVWDTGTNLEWLAGPDERTTWDAARSWVEGHPSVGGTWRMPTKEELRGLYSTGMGTRNMTPLLKTTGWWVWSAAEAEGSSAGWGFSFSRDGQLVMTTCAVCDSRAFAVRDRR